MDSTKLILTQPVMPPALLEHLDGAAFCKRAAKVQPGEVDAFSEQQKKQVAKDFESVLLSRLLNEMKNTIGDGGLDKDGISEQVHGIFWLYLARHIANNGGFGLWKNIYQSLTNSDQTSTAIESIDRNV